MSGNRQTPKRGGAQTQNASDADRTISGDKKNSQNASISLFTFQYLRREI